MSNIIELSAFKGARSAKSSEDDDQIEHRGVDGRRQARRMVFRSYSLIVETPEADLMRDVCFDTRKAQVKLKAIRRQLAADREHAAARERLLTAAESRLSAAIEAAGPLTAGKVEP